MLFIVLSVASGSFFTKVNLLDILDQQASTLIIAAAGTLVLVAGGIDLSVGRDLRAGRRHRDAARAACAARCSPSWPAWPSGS